MANVVFEKQMNLTGGGKLRQSNIELCRIISIVMVMLLHSDFQVFGWPMTLSETSLGLISLESFCIIGVNVFVLITGKNYGSRSRRVKPRLRLID